MQKLKIVQVAAWEESVPPKKYGGTELVVYNVTEGLVEKGHDVHLLAAGESPTKANFVPVFEKTLREMYPLSEYTPAEIDKYMNYWKFAKMSDVIQMINDLKPDIVHNHLNWRLIVFERFIKAPMITTLHGPLSAVNERMAYGQYKDANYISISDNQRRAMPDLNWVRTIYNGIDVGKFDFKEEPEDFFLFLGRTTPEKGLAELCKMIKETGHKLKIAAKVDRVDVEYFEKEVRPHVDGEQIEFLGEVDHAGKNELLGKAKGMLMWLNWEEPFGLTVAEAGACGTPVIVNKRGAMKELILDGQTGFLVDSLDEMKGRLGDIGKIDRHACREHIEKNFSKERMVDAYVEVMQEIVKRGKNVQ